jgi:hypothetical protein
VYRYDNAADIPARNLKTYAHHKHVGEAIEDSSGPTLQQVLVEIIRLLP